MKKTAYVLIAMLLLLIINCQKKSIQLDITSNQDNATVYVNDKSLGKTPIIASVYPGIITIKVKKEGLEDFVVIDTLNHNDTMIYIKAFLYTREELKKIKIKKKEEKLFISRQNGKFTDFRDNKKYRWVKIGRQIWMAENLAFKSSKCRAYNNDTKYSPV